MTTKHTIQFTLHCGQKIVSVYADLAHIENRIKELTEALKNTPPTFSGVITLNEGFELQALKAYLSK